MDDDYEKEIENLKNQLDSEIDEKTDKSEKVGFKSGESFEVDSDNQEENSEEEMTSEVFDGNIDDSDDSDEKDDNENEETTNVSKTSETEEVEAPEPFTANPKQKYEEVTKQPEKLNKSLINKIIIGVVIGVVAFIFVMPSIVDFFRSDEKSVVKSDKEAEKINLSDFKSQVDPNMALPDLPLEAAMMENGEKSLNANSRNGRLRPEQKYVGQDGINYDGPYFVDDNGNIVNSQGEIVMTSNGENKTLAKIEEEKVNQPTGNTYSQTTNQNQNRGGSGGGGYTRPDTRNDALQAKTIQGIKGLTSTQKRYATGYEEQVEKNAQEAAANTNSFENFIKSGAYASSIPSREEYTKNALANYSSLFNSQNQNSYALQNDQSGKMSFHEKGKENAGFGQWLGMNTVWEGSIFEAELKSSINTDLPGEITAVVTKNVYSSQNGQYLLIPQNSILIGSYNSSISYSQSRVQVAWNTLIRPDGYRIDLGNMNGTDDQGAAGIQGHINDHLFQYVKAIAVMSMFNIVSNEITQSSNMTDNTYAQNVLANSQDVANRLGEKLIERALDIQPTIKIKEGTIIKIFVNKTLTLPPLDPYPVTQKYRKF